jgi:hypothetical protein
MFKKNIKKLNKKTKKYDFGGLNLIIAIINLNKKNID